MENRGIFTREEILSQPGAWAQALEIIASQKTAIEGLLQSGRFEHVFFTGCGSTYYLALAAAALFQELSGIPARGLPASELWLYPGSAYPAHTVPMPLSHLPIRAPKAGTRQYQEGRILLVAISRSGETTETLRACAAFKTLGRGELLTLSCYPQMPLASMGGLNLVFPSGAERSVAQTRAFSTLYLGTIALAALAGGRLDLLASLDQLPGVCQRILRQVEDTGLAFRLGADFTLDRFYFLGSGARYGLACELSLKMKEMTLSHSEPFHFMEFRHGPKSMVTPSTLVTAMVSSANQTYESAVLDDLRALGARIFSLGEDSQDIAFDSGLAEPVRNILFLPAGQLVALERSLAKGLNPDNPHNLDAVVKL